MAARKVTQSPLARRHGWGGKRRGAGRKRKDGRLVPPGVPHLRRPWTAARHPVGVTLQVRRDVWSLRGRRCVAALRRALEQGHQRQGFRLVHFSILENHLHPIVEAASRASLSAGLQGLEVRMARALNRAMSRKGPVFADRFHAHFLRSPSEAARARRYVLQNFAIHQRRLGLAAEAEDAFTSERMTSCAAAPQTWLLRVGWKRERPARSAVAGAVFRE